MSPYHRARPYRSTVLDRAHARVASFLGRLARRSIRRGTRPSAFGAAA